MRCPPPFEPRLVRRVRRFLSTLAIPLPGFEEFAKLAAEAELGLQDLRLRFSAQEPWRTARVTPECDVCHSVARMTTVPSRAWRIARHRPFVNRVG
jgi:hypothetical protein